MKMETQANGDEETDNRETEEGGGGNNGSGGAERSVAEGGGGGEGGTSLDKEAKEQTKEDGGSEKDIENGISLAKVTKEQTNERLAGTSNGTTSATTPAANDKLKTNDSSETLTDSDKGSNKFAEDLNSTKETKEASNKEQKEEKKVEKELEGSEKKEVEERDKGEVDERDKGEVEEREKMEIEEREKREVEEREKKEVDEKRDEMPRVDSKIVNLETIKEGEVLQIEPDAASPQVKRTKAKPDFYFFDSVSEYEGGRDDARYSGGYDDDDAASITSLPAELPPPPDGGWGWVIVVMSFMCNAVVDGVAYSFSPYIGVLSKDFDAPKGKVAWIPSLLAGVYLSAGPIVSALSNKFGPRAVCIVGSIVASVAYFCTIFANSIEYLMVFQGIIGGFGFGLIYLPAVVCVGYYFESKRALATGIAVCGSGIGTFIFPPLVNYLIQNYTWKGANLLVSAIILNCCWCGALMRPLEVPRMKKKDLMQRLAEEKEALRREGSMYATNRDAMNADPGVHSHLNLSGYLTPVATTLALPTIEETQGNTPPDQDSPIAATEAQEAASPTTAATDDTTDEHQNLVANGSKMASAIPARLINAAAKMPRNCSQPSIARDPTRQMPKNGSVPNFERKLSKVDIANCLKVVPATPKASSTNLRGLGSQEIRRASSGYGRVNSNTSFIDAEAAVGLRQRRSSSKSMMLRPMSRHDIFYTGSIANLREFKSQESMLSYRESTLNLQGTGASKVVLDALEGPEEDTGMCACLPESMKGTLSQMMDFSLLKNPVFLLIGVANLIGMLGFYTPFVYLPDAAKAKGVEPDYATFLVSIIGITNTIGRVLSGIIADIPKVSALWVNNICIILSGVCVFLTPFATSYASFVTISLFFGFFVSAYISLSSILLVELLGLAQLTNAFGLLILFRGSASMVGPPIAGSIYDETKSYDVSFYFAGVLLFVCAGLHCLVPCVQRICNADNMPVHYTTNEEWQMDVVPEEGEEDEGAVSPDTGEGIGIILDIKPKETAVLHQDSGENKIVLDSAQNEKGKEPVSAL